MNAWLKLEEMGVDKPPNESRAKLSDLQPAELGGDRQQLNIVAGQPCGGRLLLLGEIPVLSGDGWAALGAHIRMGSRLCGEMVTANLPWVCVGKSSRPGAHNTRYQGV
jgi:hypothetical protein